LKTFIKQSKWLKVKAENVNIGIELHFYCVSGGMNAMEYRHILNVALTRYIEYVCIPLHSYHRKRNKNAVQSIYDERVLKWDKYHVLNKDIL